jgi:hypothetical protein
MRKLSCAQARQIDLVNYLKSLDYLTKKIMNNDYWYLSPLREEKEASFKVNRRLNVWYDHGIGRGGGLIDFGILYHHCTVSELLQKLKHNNLSFHPHSIHLQRPFDAGEKEKIRVVDEREIMSEKIIEYLNDKRKISVDVARQFCKEVDFVLYNKKHTAIGFKNSADGYELRNEYFKGSTSPKDVTLIENNHSKECSLFEGFFSFLSFQVLLEKDKKLSPQLPNKQTKFSTHFLFLKRVMTYWKSMTKFISFLTVIKPV